MNHLSFTTAHEKISYLMAIDIADIEANLANGDPKFIQSILKGEGWKTYSELTSNELDQQFNERLLEMGDQFENHPQTEKVRFWLCTLLKTKPTTLHKNFTAPKPNTKWVRVHLSAKTRYEYNCFVAVPETFDVLTSGDDLAFDLYRMIDGTDFIEDTEVWERGSCYTELADNESPNSTESPQYQLNNDQLELLVEKA